MSRFVLIIRYGVCPLRWLRRGLQIDGARDGHSAIQGGANIEMGGNNTHQVVSKFRGNCGVRRIEQVTTRLNTFAHTTLAHGLVFTSVEVHSIALPSQSLRTTSVLAAPIRPKSWPMALLSAAPTALSTTIVLSTLLMVALLSLVLRAVASFATRSRWKMCVPLIQLDGL